MSFSTSISEERRRAAQRPTPLRRGSPGALGRRFLIVLGTFTGALVGLSALLTWTVDPYGALGHNSVGIYASSERDAKPPLMRAMDPDTVLVGSSIVGYIDPSALGPQVFNAAFSAAMPEEIVNFLRHQVDPGTRVVVGLDAHMMNSHAYPLQPDTYATPPTASDLLAYVFGLRPAWAAIEALAASALGRPPSLLPNGQRDTRERMRRHDDLEAPEHGRWLSYLETHHFADFHYDPARLDALYDLHQVAKDKKLELYVFINPLSAPVRDLIARLPAAEAVERFRADVQEALPGAVDLSYAPDLADTDLFFRFDPFHYLPQTGQRVLRRVMARAPVHRPAAAEPPSEASLGVVRGDNYP